VGPYNAQLLDFSSSPTAQLLSLPAVQPYVECAFPSKAAWAAIGGDAAAGVIHLALTHMGTRIAFDDPSRALFAFSTRSPSLPPPSLPPFPPPSLPPPPSPPNSAVLVDGVYAWPGGSYATSCHTYRNPPSGVDFLPSTEDGTYTIQPSASVSPFDVYCDMTTDGGGWTLVDNDATNEATISSRQQGANPDITVTRGSLLPAYTWSSSPLLMCKSSYYNGNLPWVTFNVLGAGLNYPTTATIANSGTGGLFSEAKYNGNSNQQASAWIYVGSSRIGTVWIGHGSSSTCSCNYTGSNSGIGGYTSSSSTTCSTWVK